MLSRFRRTDDGSVAVLAALTIPVVLLCVALAMATIVWSSSEHEAQRAADAAAARAAATAFLGTDFPYEAVPGVSAPLTYPNVAAIAAAFGRTVPANLSECGTVGVPPSSLTKPLSLTVYAHLPVDCSAVDPFVVPGPLDVTDQTYAVACATARDAMAPESAPYGNKFYSETGDAQPSCDLDSAGRKRIDVRLASGSAFLGFGEHATDAATGVLDTQVAPQLPAVATALAALGVHLDTSLPSLLCPEVSVTIDQPVREPVFDRKTSPNGRATARRIVKNAVVVPVYEGRVITAATSDDVHGSAFGTGVDMTGSTGTTVHVPPANLNSLLLDAQQQLLTLLDEVDATMDAAARAANVTVDRLNGTYDGIDPTVAQPPPAPGVAPLDGLGVTKCLRDTLAQIYDPPSGAAPSADDVLRDAAANGEEVVVVQVGAVRAACTEHGAIATVLSAAGSPAECIRAATTPTFDPTSLLYEVPFFDATPVLVQDLGDHNYAAVPVHASQASGAFRAGLVRAADDERYDPKVEIDEPTPACSVTVASPTPGTACDILSVTPPPLPTVSPSLPVPTSLVPTLPSLSPLPTSPPPTSPLPTLPTTLPTLPTLSPSPSPTKTTCTLLICKGSP